MTRTYKIIADKMCKEIEDLPPKGQLHVISSINEKFDLSEVIAKVKK